MNEIERLKKWRQSKISGMTCIRCDKKMGVSEHTTGYDEVVIMPATEDPCICVSPIKVDMNVVDHHMVTEMGYLTQKARVNKKYGMNHHKLSALKGYDIFIQERDPEEVNPEKKPEPQVEGEVFPSGGS